VLVQWCLKGVAKSKTFDDAEALKVLSDDGLTSNWIRKNHGTSLGQGLRDGHAALSDTALARHVNAYATVAADTPYLSLSAGVNERDPVSGKLLPHPAWTTALDFATGGGRHDGYVFECWVHLPGNPAPELPGFGEEVRNLNLHRRFTTWLQQGEIAAKLVVPPRQIKRVMKFSTSLVHVRLKGDVNKHFVPPERVSNIRNYI